MIPSRSARLPRFLSIALCACFSLWSSRAYADSSTLPEAQASLPPHAIGEVFNYTLTGTMSQAIDGRDPFGASIRQAAIPTSVEGRERVAIKAITVRGLSLHRVGTIVATFRGKSSPAQRGSGWTLVTPDGGVDDRKGSTLGGLFLLPLGFLGERSVDGGSDLQLGARWTAKLGMALFGMTARPRLSFEVVGVRKVFGVTAYSLSATGTAPVREPIVTNDDIALGDAMGTAHVTLRCDYDPQRRRVLSMAIDVTDDLRTKKTGRGASKIHDHLHYLVALDVSSIQAPDPATPPPAP